MTLLSTADIIDCLSCGLRQFFNKINQSLIISREGLILTLSILPCPQRRIFWSTPCRKIDAERLSVLHQKLGRYWEIHPLRPPDFRRPSRFPSGFALGKSLGSREIFRPPGMDFPIPPSSWWSTDSILPCWQGCTLDPSLQNGTD